jgi:hypothetical protein
MGIELIWLMKMLSEGLLLQWKIHMLKAQTLIT